MNRAIRYLPSKALAGSGVLLTALSLLTGCVVREVVSAPPSPPRPVYEAPPPAPPPPSDYEPVADNDMRANEPPPPIPDYDQPPCPEDGYLWTPGYWAWGPGGYYWVPGTWVQPPRVGVLWTPGYWGFVGGVYVFNRGYWGPHVGYYGGVNYGYGYVGVGFAGGRWQGNSFAYNRNVTNVNVTVVHNTFNETVVNNVTVNKVSYNGGPGGTAARPLAQEIAARNEQHVPPTALQRQHFNEAARNPQLSARVNGGHPGIAATPRPAAFQGPGVVGARGAAFNGSGGQGAARFNRGGDNNAANQGARGPSPRFQPGGAGAVQPGAGQPGAGQPNGGRPFVNPGQPHVLNPGQPHAVQPGAPAPGGARPQPQPRKQVPASPQRSKAEDHKHDNDRR